MSWHVAEKSAISGLLTGSFLGPCCFSLVAQFLYIAIPWRQAFDFCTELYDLLSLGCSKCRMHLFIELNQSLKAGILV